MVLAYPAGAATVALLVIGGCEYRVLLGNWKHIGLISLSNRHAL